MDRSPITVFEHMDPEFSPYNGITTFVRSLIEIDLRTYWEIASVELSSSSFEKQKVWQATGNLRIVPVQKIAFASTRKFLPNSFLYALHIFRSRHLFFGNSIHCHRVELGLISLILFKSKPLIQFVHNTRKDLTDPRTSSSFWRFLPFVHNLISKFVYKRARLIVSVSKGEYEIAYKMNPNSILIKNWYNDSCFFPNSSYQNELPKIDLVWVGRLESEKNPLFSILVLRYLLNCNYVARLHIAGDGSLMQSLKSLVKEQSLQEYVEIHGQLNQEELAKLLNSSSVFLQTSLYEGSPTALIEALACGTPVVTSVKGDPDETILDSINGFRISGWDPSEFGLAALKSAHLSRKLVHETVSDRAKSVVALNLLDLIKQKS